MDSKNPNSLTRRRDLRRDRLQNLLNKDAHGLAVSKPTLKEPLVVKTSSPTASSPLIATTATPASTPSPIPAPPATPAIPLVHDPAISLREIRKKYSAMKGLIGTRPTIPLRLQRKQMLFNRNRARVNFADTESIDEEPPQIDAVAATSEVPVHAADRLSKVMGVGDRLKRIIPFSDPLRRWKDSRRKHITESDEEKSDAEDLKSDEEEEMFVPPAADASGESIASPTASDNAKFETAAVSVIQAIRLSSSNDIREEHRTFPAQSSTSNLNAGSPNLSPEIEFTLRRFQEFVESSSRTLAEHVQHLKIIDDQINHIKELQESQDLLPTVKRLEFSLEELELRMSNLVGDSNRVNNERLQKLSLSLKRSLDIVLDKIESSNQKLANKGGVYKPVQEYVLSWFVIGLSTVLVPFGYIYHIATSRCRSARRRPQRTSKRKTKDNMMSPKNVSSVDTLSSMQFNKKIEDSSLR